jgi:hypothetical protein
VYPPKGTCTDVTMFINRVRVSGSIVCYGHDYCVFWTHTRGNVHLRDVQIRSRDTPIHIAGWVTNFTAARNEISFIWSVAQNFDRTTRGWSQCHIRVVFRKKEHFDIIMRHLQYLNPMYAPTCTALALQPGCKAELVTPQSSTPKQLREQQRPR